GQAHGTWYTRPVTGSGTGRSRRRCVGRRWRKRARLHFPRSTIPVRGVADVVLGVVRTHHWAVAESSRRVTRRLAVVRLPATTASHWPRVPRPVRLTVVAQRRETR